MDTQTILEILTINGATALNLDNLALIKPGYKADLQLIDIKKDSFSIPIIITCQTYFMQLKLVVLRQ